MDESRWQQMENIFHQALSFAPGERKGYLDQACSHDPSLREEIDSLIKSHDENEAFLMSPVLSRGLRVLANDRPTSSLAGERIGSYQVISLLGTGGMGSVYLAFDSRLGRNVALKVLAPAAARDAHYDRRFKQEARLASQISHPNVASIYEVDEVDGQQFIAMELIDGVTLRQRLARGRLPLSEKLDIMLQVGRALAAAHAIGIIHRDIKPENIMIRPDGYVKVLDFGLAKLTDAAFGDNDSDDPRITLALTTEPAVIMGTVAYMSPEQVRAQKLDHRTDIWSWGVVLYELVTGEMPFQGDSRGDIVAEILRAEPVGITVASSIQPQALAAVIQRCLCKEKEARYQQIAEPANELNVIGKRLDDDNRGRVDPGRKNRQGAQARITSPTQAARSGSVNTPNFTEAHVIADDFPTIAERAHPTLGERPSINIKRYRVPAAIILATLLVITIAGLLVYRLRTAIPHTPNPQFTRLFIPGNIKEGVISPDGRFVATVTDNAGKDAVALRQLSTAKDLQLAPPASEHYRGLSFSPDGDYLYYLKEEGNTAALFRVSVLGGTPTQVADNVGSRVTFSPDGRRLAFIRIYISTGTDELVTANLDGTEQTIAAKSPLPDHFQGIGFFSSGPAWSPDGKLIVCITKRNDRATAQLFAVKLQDGSAVRIDTQDWFEIERIAWLADGTALLIQAKDQQKSNFQLWLLTYPDGKAQRITNDPNRYINLSATRDSGTLLATTSSQVASVWTVTPGKSGSGVKVPFSDYIGSGGISWTPDGRLVYSSRESGESSIWIMNLDGSQRRQLTFKQNDSNAAVSPDGRYVVFVRVGATRQLWRMRLDGSEQRPLAEHALGDYPRFSPDGKWVIYRTALAGAYLRRVSIDGGEPEDLIQQMATQPDVSPDGKSIACFAQEAQDKSPWLLAVFSASGTMQKSFALPKGVFLPSGLRWTPSGDALTFVVTNDGVSNIWRQPVNGDLAKQLTDFKNDRILQFAWSADGRLAIVRSADQNDLFLITDFR